MKNYIAILIVILANSLFAASPSFQQLTNSPGVVGLIADKLTPAAEAAIFRDATNYIAGGLVVGDGDAGWYNTIDSNAVAAAGYFYTAGAVIAGRFDQISGSYVIAAYGSFVSLDLVNDLNSSTIARTGSYIGANYYNTVDDSAYCDFASLIQASFNDATNCTLNATYGAIIAGNVSQVTNCILTASASSLMVLPANNNSINVSAGGLVTGSPPPGIALTDSGDFYHFGNATIMESLTVTNISSGQFNNVVSIGGASELGTATNFVLIAGDPRLLPACQVVWTNNAGYEIIANDGINGARFVLWGVQPLYFSADLTFNSFTNTWSRDFGVSVGVKGFIKGGFSINNGQIIANTIIATNFTGNGVGLTNLPSGAINNPPWATNTAAGIAAAGGDTNSPNKYVKTNATAALQIPMTSSAAGVYGWVGINWPTNTSSGMQSYLLLGNLPPVNEPTNTAGTNFNFTIVATNFTGNGVGLTNLSSGGITLPVIQAGKTNGTGITSLTVFFKTAMPSTNYTVSYIGNGATVAAPFVSAKTTSSFTVTMTIFTGIIDWMVVQQL